MIISSSCSFPLNVDQAGDHQTSTESGDLAQRSYEISAENNEYCANKANNQRFPLPRKRKACFFLSYSCFVIFYLAFLLVIAYTYPLKPVCNIQDSDIQDFYNVSLINSTEKAKDSFYLVLEFKNRNPLISVSYDDFLNITVYYISNSNVSVNYFAETATPGFNQPTLNHTQLTVHVPAPELSQISQMRNTSVAFVVNLDFKVSFHNCRVAAYCKKKHNMTLNRSYEF